MRVNLFDSYKTNVEINIIAFADASLNTKPTLQLNFSYSYDSLFLSNIQGGISKTDMYCLLWDWRDITKNVKT